MPSNAKQRWQGSPAKFSGELGVNCKQDDNERNPDVSGRVTRSARASLPADLSERMKEMRSK